MRSTSAVLESCPDWHPPPQVTVKPVGMLHPEKLFSWHSSIHFLFLHKAVLKSCNLIEVCRDSTTDSENVCPVGFIFVSFCRILCKSVVFRLRVSAQVRDGGLDACIYSDRNATQHAFEPLCCSTWNIYVKAEWSVSFPEVWNVGIPWEAVWCQPSNGSEYDSKECLTAS